MKNRTPDYVEFLRIVFPNGPPRKIEHACAFCGDSFFEYAGRAKRVATKKRGRRKTACNECYQELATKK